VSGESGKDELYRRLEQARRLVTPTLDPTTRERIGRLISDLESDLAAIEARDADTPTE
jgi:hypothetical protein